jgi:hypothetical protein
MANNSEDNEIFFVFDDSRPVEVVGLKNLNAKLAKKSEPVLRQEVLWGTNHYEEYFANVPAENRTVKATEFREQCRNAALVAKMQLDRLSAKQAASPVWRPSLIQFFCGIILVGFAALLTAYFAGYWDGPLD